MGLPEDAADMLRDIDGVVDAYLMDDELSNVILEEERSVVSITQMDVINNAYEDVMKRDYRICIIFENDVYKMEKDNASIVMVNSKNEIVGTAVPEGKMKDFLDRSDVVWLSPDFVMFNNAQADGGEKFVIPASSFTMMNNMRCYRDAIVASPATTSDMILKKYHGAPLDQRTSTIVVGFNLL